MTAYPSSKGQNTVGDKAGLFELGECLEVYSAAIPILNFVSFLFLVKTGKLLFPACSARV